MKKPVSLAERLPRLEGAVPPAWLNRGPAQAPRPLLKGRRSVAPAPQHQAQQQPLDVEAIKREAHAQGEAAGVAAARKKVEEILSRYGQAIERLTIASEALGAGAVETIVDMAMAVAREVIGRELMIDPEPVARAIEEALGEMGATRPITVRLGSTDLAFFKARRPDLLNSGIELTEDNTLGIGGCVIEGAHRDVEASFEAHLDRIGDRIRRQLEAPAPRASVMRPRPSLVPPPADGEAA